MEQYLSKISDEWLNIIYAGETKRMLDNIYNELLNGESSEIDKITPPIENWFNWCRFAPLDDIRIVILGQDPYFKKGWDHGLSFSCLEKIPPPLMNIYKCLLKANLIDTIPKCGDLTPWAKQNILLLNSALSTKIGKAGEHMSLWLPYTQLVVKRICEYHYNKCEQLIFMLWGNFAKKFTHFIDVDFHIILDWMHPSPLAQRGPDKHLFINCSNFQDANTLLSDDDKQPINWNAINTVKSSKPEDPSKVEKTSKSSKPEDPSKVEKTNKPEDPSKVEKTNKSRKAGDPSKYNDAKSILNMNPLHCIAFTDGGCHPNNKSDKSRAGWALTYVSGPMKDELIYGNLPIAEHNASNIRAEGMAIIRSLECADESPHTWDKITIVTDCKFWIEMVEMFMPKWNKATFASKANPDLTQRLWSIYNKVSKKKEVQLMHIRSHNKDGWSSFEDGSFEKFCYVQNDYVDKICNYARTKLQPGVEIHTVAEYE
jgi:uracil-DNA glycosylase